MAQFRHLGANEFIDIASYHTQPVFVLLCGNTKYHTNTDNWYKVRALSVVVIKNVTMFFIIVILYVYQWVAAKSFFL
jgi:hypothetical protein